MVITRTFDAPRELVFKAWTDPEVLVHWFGPKHCPATRMELEARVGGTWRSWLRLVETGGELRVGGVFREVVAPERLVFTFAWEEEGERGLETLVTVTFAEEKGKTVMVFRHAPFQSQGEFEGHTDGWTSCFERLEERLRK